MFLCESATVHRISNVNVEGIDLGNPVWDALQGAHREFAEVNGRAVRYRSDVSVFAAVDELDAAAWDDLAPFGEILLIRRELPTAPDGWAETWSFRLHQMVATELTAPRATEDVRALGAADVDAMLELTGLAGPGPFLRGTPQFGGYVGVFDGAQLVAMAGQRMRLPEFTEVSAVCTRPEARGRGLGELVSYTVASAILARGERPFLHVAIDNDNAIRLYERLGFRHHDTVAIAGYELSRISRVESA
jgi:ribosomal protein S18 acetylase RimI-like enzyme